jgi:hypothetical protein
MSLRFDLDELRLKLAQLRLHGSLEGAQELDDMERLAERIAAELADMRERAWRGRRWQWVVVFLGVLAAATAMFWRWPDFSRPPVVIDRPAPAPPAPAPTPAPCPLGVDARSLGAVLDALAKAGAKEGANSAATLSIGLLRDIVQGLISAGGVTAEAGGKLLKELQAEAIKRGGEITVEFAKALIDRYIRPHDGPKASEPAPSASAVLAGSAVNVYCSFAPPPVAARPAAPAPRPVPRPGPCTSPKPPVAACPAAAASAAG